MGTPDGTMCKHPKPRLYAPDVVANRGPAFFARVLTTHQSFSRTAPDMHIRMHTSLIPCAVSLSSAAHDRCSPRPISDHLDHHPSPRTHEDARGGPIGTYPTLPHRPYPPMAVTELLGAFLRLLGGYPPAVYGTLGAR